MTQTKTYTNEREQRPGEHKEETHMKAMMYHTYGSPDVLKLEEVQKPVPQDDEVLVQVHATSVNAGDWHLLRAKPFLMRFMGFGLLKPKHTILGSDIAGRVEVVGRNVTQFQSGDEVFGNTAKSGFGGFAEYVAVPENALVLKPTNISFEEAAAVPQAALTALQGLRDKGHIQKGQKVLIHGAGGGVGTFAVQIAKSFGADVTAVCSTRNLDMVRSLGADHVIDYTKEDFAKGDQRYDVVLDNVPNHSLSECRRVLNPQGKYIMIGGGGPNDNPWIGPFGRVIQALLEAPFVSQKMAMMMAELKKSDLAILGDMMQSGKLKPVIDRTYKLSELPAAIAYLEEGHARGKVVITVE